MTEAISPTGVKTEAGSGRNSEFVQTNELSARIRDWKREHPGNPVVMEIGSRSNNNDGVILQSSRSDIEGEPLLVIHVDPLNQATDRVSGAEPTSHSLIVRDVFDQELAKNIRGQVDMAVIIGLVPEEDVEKQIMSGVQVLNPEYVYVTTDTNSGDREMSGYTANESKRNIARSLGNGYSREDPILPADVRPSSSIVTRGNSVTLVFERN